MSAMTGLAAAMFIRRVPERALVVTQTGLLLRMRLALGVPSVRAYLRLVVQSFFTESLILPFFVVMLRSRGLPDGYIVLMGAAAAVGHVAGLQLWARSVDTHGGRPALSMTLVGVALQGLAWLALPTVPAGATHLVAIWPLLAWSGGFYLLWGFFRGGFLMGRTHFLLEAVPHQFQTDGFTLVRLAEAAGGGLGALLGGLAFQALTAHPVTWLGLDGRVLYLAAAQLAMLLVWPAKSRLAGHAQQTTAREYLATAWQLLLRRQEQDRP
jgi:MFS family permease